MRIRFRSEFFNIFSHPNFGNPNNTLNSPLFGHSTQTLASSLGSGEVNGGFNPSTKSAALAPSSSLSSSNSKRRIGRLALDRTALSGGPLGLSL